MMPRIHFPGRAAIAGTLVVVTLYVLPIAGRVPVPNPNELVRLELAVALGVLGTVDLGPVASVWGVSEDVAVVDGGLRADKAPGLSLAAAPIASLMTAVAADAREGLPPYWPLRHLAVLLLVALPTAAAAWLASRLGEGRQDRMAALFALATPLWCYATLFFGHAPAAALVAVAWWMLLTGDEEPRGVRALVGGAAVGLAVATEYPTALLAAVMAVTLGRRGLAWRSTGLVLAGALAALLPTLVYHQIAFGAPWATGYLFKADPAFATIHSSGFGGVGPPRADALWGVLFGLSRGLFAYAPWLALAPVGLVSLIRRRPRDGWPLTASVAVYVAFAAGFVDWTAGWCAAARHLIPAVPLVALAALEASRRVAASTVGAVVVGATIGVSVVRGWATLAVTPMLPPEFTAPLAQVAAPTLAEGIAAPTLASVGTGIPAVVPWIAMLLAAIVVASWSAAGLTRSRRRAIVTAVVVAAGLQVLQLGWAASRTRPDLEPLRQQLLVRVGLVQP